MRAKARSWVAAGSRRALRRPRRRDTSPHPEQNGRHERFHRTLKDETARPSRANLGCQRRRFDHFRIEYNQERPHRALQGNSPAPRFQ